MATLRYNRVFVWLFADDPRKRYALQRRIVVFQVRVSSTTGLFRGLFCPWCRSPSPDPAPSLACSPLARTGICSCRRKKKAAEAGLLVVFTDIGREVGDGDCADVCGCFNGADGFGWGVGVFLDEGLVVGMCLCRSRRFLLRLEQLVVRVWCLEGLLR